MDSTSVDRPVPDYLKALQKRDLKNVRIGVPVEFFTEGIDPEVEQAVLEILEDRLTLWDEAEAACVFVSGMAAIATSLLAYCRPGDVVVHSEPLYGGTDHMLRAVLPQFGIRAVGFPAGVPVDLLAPRLRAELEHAHIGCVLIETPANPTNALVDIAGVAALIKEIDAGERKPVVIVDNTFLGPLWQQPLAHGADIVLYSATKFLGGNFFTSRCFN